MRSDNMAETKIIDGLKVTIIRNCVNSKTDIVDAFIKIIEQKIKKKESYSDDRADDS
jgi:hypothetical protein